MIYLLLMLGGWPIARMNVTTSLISSATVG